jgi:hypothetical protein
MGRGASTAQGAAQGAALGTMVMPGYGTAIGAGLGGLYGYFGGGGGVDRSRGQLDQSQFNLPGYQTQYNTYGRMAESAGGRAAPQAGLSGFRGDQTALVRMLQAQAAGQGPGQDLVRMQAQQVADRGMAQQLAAARGARPSAGPGAFMGAAQNAATMQSQVGGQAAQAGLQAQLGAIGQLSGTLQGARGQDENMSQFNANALLQNRSMNDEKQLELLRQRLLASNMQQQGQVGYQTANLGKNMATPTDSERYMSALQGGMQAVVMSRAGQGGGGGSIPYNSPYGTNTGIGGLGPSLRYGPDGYPIYG